MFETVVKGFLKRLKGNTAPNIDFLQRESNNI